MNITAALYTLLADDAPLVAMLSPYKGNPGIFTIEPVPGDASAPYLVSAGAVMQVPWDTKTSRGRHLIRDVRAYAPADGSTLVVDAIIERVRALLHRRALVVDGFEWVISNVSGPIAVDEPDFYGRVVSLDLRIQEA